MKEIWKAIPEYEGSFEVSNLGNFRSLDRMVPSRYGSPRKYPGKPLKVEEMKDGYKRIVTNTGVIINNIPPIIGVFAFSLYS